MSKKIEKLMNEIHQLTEDIKMDEKGIAIKVLAQSVIESGIEPDKIGNFLIDFSKMLEQIPDDQRLQTFRNLVALDPALLDMTLVKQIFASASCHEIEMPRITSFMVNLYQKIDRLPKSLQSDVIAPMFLTSIANQFIRKT
jgi:hypothetical protein